MNIIGQKFFSARVVDLWSELDESRHYCFSGNVPAFKRRLGKFGYGFHTDYKSSEPLETLVR